MLLFSDLHLKPESEQIVLGEVLPGIREACERHNDRFVGFLGDFYHLRYTVDVRLQNAVRDELKLWHTRGIQLWVLPGNHDQVDLQGRNALEVFDALPNVQVWTEPTWTHFGLWVPYRARHQDIQAAIAIPNPYPKKWPNVLFLHHGLRGAFMNNLMADPDGLPVEMFQTFDAVLCGHYHKRQQIGDRAWYIGSPWQTKADELGQPKGYAVWDGKALKYVDCDWGPKHYKLIVESPDQKIDLSFVRPQDKVRVEVRHAGVDTEKMAAQIAATGVLPVIDHNIEHKVEARLGDANSIEEYVARYAGMFADEQKLDVTRLVQTFVELTR
jgi:DNA repair exonuclease SbcCD nuclease subunit